MSFRKAWIIVDTDDEWEDKAVIHFTEPSIRQYYSEHVKEVMVCNVKHMDMKWLTK